MAEPENQRINGRRIIVIGAIVIFVLSLSAGLLGRLAVHIMNPPYNPPPATESTSRP